jgi:hypothetical protein
MPCHGDIHGHAEVIADGVCGKRFPELPADGIDCTVRAEEPADARLEELQALFNTPVEAVLIVPAAGIQAQFARDPAHLRIGKVADQHPDGVTIEQRVGIREDENRGLRPPDQIVEHIGLATIHLERERPDPFVSIAVQDGRRGIAAAIRANIGSQELRGIVEFKEVLDPLTDVALLVVGRDDDRDRREFDLPGRTARALGEHVVHILEHLGDTGQAGEDEWVEHVGVAHEAD